VFIEGGLYLHILSLNLRPIILELYGSFIDGKFLKWPYGAELVKISNFGNFYFFKFFFSRGYLCWWKGTAVPWHSGKMGSGKSGWFHKQLSSLVLCQA